MGKLSRITRRTLRELATGSRLIQIVNQRGAQVYLADGQSRQWLVPARKAQKLIEGGYVQASRTGLVLSARGRQVLR